MTRIRPLLLLVSLLQAISSTSFAKEQLSPKISITRASAQRFPDPYGYGLTMQYAITDAPSYVILRSVTTQYSPGGSAWYTDEAERAPSYTWDNIHGNLTCGSSRFNLESGATYALRVILNWNYEGDVVYDLPPRQTVSKVVDARVDGYWCNPGELKGAVSFIPTQDTNGCVENVSGSFGSMENGNRSHPRDTFRIQRNGAPNPNNYWHWQSINRLNHPDGRYLVMTKSEERTPGVFAVAHMGSVNVRSDGEWLGKLVLPPFFGGGNSSPDAAIVTWLYAGDKGGPKLNHAGGAQLLGNYLAFGLECHDFSECANTGARVQLWDLSQPLNPRLHSTLNLGPGLSRKAGTVTLTKLDDGRFLLVVGGSDAKVLEFYEASALTGPWRLVDTLKPGGGFFLSPTNFPRLTWGAYQNIQAVTECGTGDVYLVTTKGHTPVVGGEDWSYLYRLTNVGQSKVSLQYVGSKHMYCGNDCNFDAGTGVFTTGGKLTLYGVEHDNDGVGGTIKFRQFWNPVK